MIRGARKRRKVLRCKCEQGYCPLHSQRVGDSRTERESQTIYNQRCGGGRRIIRKRISNG